MLSSNVTKKLLRLPWKMALMIDPRHIWNVLYNEQSNRCYPPTSPNSAPGTKKNLRNFRPKTAETSCTMRGRSETIRFGPTILLLYYSLTLLSFGSTILWLYYSLALLFSYSAIFLLFHSFTLVFFGSTILWVLLFLREKATWIARWVADWRFHGRIMHMTFQLFSANKFRRTFFRGRHTSWWRWKVTSVAPLIVIS